MSHPSNEAAERWRRGKAQIDARLARPLLTVGLTGGIAAGKSTVDAMFEALGAGVIDADTIVHGLLAPGGAAVASVLEAFGSGVGDRAGGVDRGALGAVVFADPAVRARLEAILHPLVNDEIVRRIVDCSARPGATIVIVDAALLVETGADRQFDRVVVVTCRDETQVERLVSCRGLSRDEALRRAGAQATAQRKAERADYRIDNDGDLAATRQRVGEVHRALLLDYERKKETWNPPPSS